MPAQKVPAINAAGVSILPVELDRIAPNRMSAGRTRRRLIHLQQLLRLRLRLSRFALLDLPLFHASSARTRIAQPGKVPMAAVTVFPVDLHASAFSLQHTHLSRR